eukprot:TRINITY_DN184_c0_g2_i1.p1 TRINITY_DN184_c0_g2~~TRINITY_DN184_c0_g2_i1.p1  ORF type:complete len:1369 (+),score=306.76 TRINITY_DN184_c0_g2_i1:193-4107(+)
MASSSATAGAAEPVVGSRPLAMSKVPSRMTTQSQPPGVQANWGRPVSPHPGRDARSLSWKKAPPATSSVSSSTATATASRAPSRQPSPKSRSPPPSKVPRAFASDASAPASASASSSASAPAASPAAPAGIRSVSGSQRLAARTPTPVLQTRERSRQKVEQALREQTKKSRSASAEAERQRTVQRSSSFRLRGGNSAQFPPGPQTKRFEQAHTFKAMFSSRASVAPSRKSAVPLLRSRDSLLPGRGEATTMSSLRQRSRELSKEARGRSADSGCSGSGRRCGQVPSLSPPPPRTASAAVAPAAFTVWAPSPSAPALMEVMAAAATPPSPVPVVSAVSSPRQDQPWVNSNSLCSSGGSPPVPPPAANLHGAPAEVSVLCSSSRMGRGTPTPRSNRRRVRSREPEDRSFLASFSMDSPADLHTPSTEVSGYYANMSPMIREEPPKKENIPSTFLRGSLTRELDSACRLQQDAAITTPLRSEPSCGTLSLSTGPSSGSGSCGGGSAGATSSMSRASSGQLSHGLLVPATISPSVSALPLSWAAPQAPEAPESLISSKVAQIRSLFERPRCGSDAGGSSGAESAVSSRRASCSLASRWRGEGAGSRAAEGEGPRAAAAAATSEKRAFTYDSAAARRLGEQTRLLRQEMMSERLLSPEEACRVSGSSDDSTQSPNQQQSSILSEGSEGSPTSQCIRAQEKLSNDMLRNLKALHRFAGAVSAAASSSRESQERNESRVRSLPPPQRPSADAAAAAASSATGVGSERAAGASALEESSQQASFVLGCLDDSFRAVAGSATGSRGSCGSCGSSGGAVSDVGPRKSTDSGCSPRASTTAQPEEEAEDATDLLIDKSGCDTCTPRLALKVGGKDLSPEDPSAETADGDDNEPAREPESEAEAAAAKETPVERPSREKPGCPPWMQTPEVLPPKTVLSLPTPQLRRLPAQAPEQPDAEPAGAAVSAASASELFFPSDVSEVHSEGATASVLRQSLEDSRAVCPEAFLASSTENSVATDSFVVDLEPSAIVTNDGNVVAERAAAAAAARSMGTEQQQLSPPKPQPRQRSSSFVFGPLLPGRMPLPPPTGPAMVEVPQNGMPINETLLYRLEYDFFYPQCDIIVPEGMLADRQVEFEFFEQKWRVTIPEDKNPGDQFSMMIPMNRFPRLERNYKDAALRGHEGRADSWNLWRVISYPPIFSPSATDDGAAGPIEESEAAQASRRQAESRIERFSTEGLAAEGESVAASLPKGEHALARSAYAPSSQLCTNRHDMYKQMWGRRMTPPFENVQEDDAAELEAEAEDVETPNPDFRSIGA